MRQILVAPDSFKGTFPAPSVASAIGRGLERAGFPPPDLCPVADGGEGTLAALLTALGGSTAGASVSDPLGRPVQAGFGLIEDGATAGVEVAEASGLGRVAEDERDAEGASSRGTGELIAAAVQRGAQVVLVAAGGIATTDGGLGAIEAITEAGGLRGARLVVLSDVRTPFEAAARVFAPQKGADAAAVKRLSRRLDKLGASWPRDPRGVPMTGAAGGLAGGVWGGFRAGFRPGASFLLDAPGYHPPLRAAAPGLLGGGRPDQTRPPGKVLGEAATRARQAGVPCFAIVGTNALDLFSERILDLQRVLEAPTLDDVEAAAESLADVLPTR